MDSAENDVKTPLFDSINENHGPIHWDDKYFKTHFMEQNKLAGRLPLHQTLEYAKAFLNWYISGKGAGKLLDMWIGLVGGMLVPTQCISHKYLLIDTMFCGKIGENQAVKLDPVGPVRKITEFIYANEGTAFSSCEAKTWYYRMFDMLDSSVANPYSNGVTASVLLAINYLGYIALTLLKVMVKDAPKISQHITKNVTNEFKGFWHSFNNSCINTRTPPPHRFAMQQFEHIIQKISPSCIKILTFVVATYVYSDPFYKPNTQKILKTACLDFLDLYGMGCLYWLQKAQESCSTSPEALMNYMATSRNRETNKALRCILTDYANPLTNQHTWHWARLFVDKAFTEISTSKNPEYAATMAALSCKGDDSSPIWKISQFRDENLKRNAIRTARIILSKLNASASNRSLI